MKSPTLVPDKPQEGWDQCYGFLSNAAKKLLDITCNNAEPQLIEGYSIEEKDYLEFMNPFKEVDFGRKTKEEQKRNLELLDELDGQETSYMQNCEELLNILK